MKHIIYLSVDDIKNLATLARNEAAEYSKESEQAIYYAELSDKLTACANKAQHNEKEIEKVIERLTKK